jgi:hypothetical protein
MAIFKKRLNIGKVIYDRVKGFPVMKKEPKKKLARWIICPDFKIKPPKMLDREERDENYCYSVLAYSSSHSEIYEMLDYLIRCGKEPVEADNVRFYLHAVKHEISRVKAKQLFQAQIQYIFRAEESPEEIL